MNGNQIHKSAETLNATLSALPEKAFTVAFFINNTETSQDEWLNPLAAYLGQNGYITVGIKTPNSQDKCNLDSAQYQAVIEQEQIATLSGIKVFLISDIDWQIRFPDSSRVLGCAHAFEASQDTSLPYMTRLGSCIDGYMVPFTMGQKCHEMISDLWNGLLNIETASRSNPLFCVIPQGYPRLHILSRKIKELGNKPDSIIFAPQGTMYNMSDGGCRLQNYGKRIIRTLLTNFPDLNIIFRPYRLDLDSAEVKEICAAFTNEKRFILDSRRGRAFSFSRGAVLVTDLSHIAQSFAYTTLRGAIYFQPWVDDTKVKSGEWTGGLFAYNFTSLISSLKNMLDKTEEWVQKIRKNRDQLVAPFENSFAEIADWLKDFCHGAPRKNWCAIKRVNQEQVQTIPEIIKKIMKQSEPARPLLAATAATYTYKNNPLLYALSLHIGKAIMSDSNIFLLEDIKKNIPIFLNKSFTAKKYKEIASEDICCLYSLGLLKMIKENNPEGVHLARNLAENFENFCKNQPGYSINAGYSNGNMKETAILTELEIEKLLDSLPNDKFVVGLYINTLYAQQDEWLNALATKLNDNDYITIGIVTPQNVSKCNLQAAQYNIVLSMDKIKNLGRINVFIISDMDCGTHFPKKSKILACVHAFYMTEQPTSLPTSVHFAAIADGWMIPMRINNASRKAIHSLWDGFVANEFSWRKANQFSIIPVGYPRIASMLPYIQANESQATSIIYAPVAIEYSNDQGGKRVSNHGIRIIKTILDNFPYNNLIFRPSMQDMEKPEVKEIQAVFDDEKRFVFDSHPDQIFAFSRGCALITTDLSNIAKSFAFLCKRPGINFLPWQESTVPWSRWDGGFNAYSYEGLLDAVKIALENPREEAEIIERNREKGIMPFESAFDEIAEWLPDFYNDKPRKDWVTIEKGTDISPVSENTIIKKIQKLPFLWVAAYAASVFNNPKSPLLCAFALHCGVKEQPASYIIFGLYEVLNNLTGQDVKPSLRYSQIQPSIVFDLYNNALAEKQKANDKKGYQIVQSLINDFTSLCNDMGLKLETVAENHENFCKNQPVSSRKKDLSNSNAQESNVLTESELEQLLSSLPDDKLVVGLYIGYLYAQQDEWLNALAVKLNEKGYITIGIINPQISSRCNLQAAQYNVELSGDKIRKLDRINVFIASDIDYWTSFPEKSKVLACVHSFVYPESRPFDMSGSIHQAALVDGWMLPMKIDDQSREAIHNLWDGFVSHYFSRRKSDQFHIIPVGYPRLASMLTHIRAHEIQPDSLVYAPVSIDYSQEAGGRRVATHGIRIIEALLDNFPDHNVIFRPSMQDMEKPEVKEILAVYGDEKRFIFDTHPDQIFAFSRGSALITDLSNITKSFAFLCKRPGINFMPWQESNAPWSRWGGGFNAYTYEGLLEAVKMALENSREEAEIIERNREKELMPFESAFDEIAEWLPDFYNDKPRKEWVPIERGPTVKPIGENELVKKIGEKPPYCNDAYAAALFNNRHSPLFAALALHYGLKECPSSHLITGLPDMLNRLLGIELPSLKYSQIKPYLVNQLYKKALAEKQKNNDIEGCQLVENLMREFELLCSERKLKNDKQKSG